MKLNNKLDLIMGILKNKKFIISLVVKILVYLMSNAQLHGKKIIFIRIMIVFINKIS